MTHSRSSPKPRIPDPTSRSIAENSVSNTPVGTPVSATDPNGDAITYPTSGADAASFNIGSTDGQITTGAALDYETHDPYSVTAEAADPYGATSTIGVPISVTDVPDVPGQPSVPTMTSGHLELNVSWSPLQTRVLPSPTTTCITGGHLTSPGRPTPSPERRMGARTSTGDFPKTIVR